MRFFPDGLPTEKERRFMEDHAEARRINEARDEGLTADFMDFREQDQYVGDSSVKFMLWEAADGADHLHYETGTVYIYDEDERVVGRVQVEGRSPHSKATPGATMCLAFSRPDEPLESRHDIGATWSREERLIESEDITEHGGAHGIVAKRMWDQREMAEALSEALAVEAPSLR